MHYFQDILGLTKTCGKMVLPSPFPEKNMRLLCADRVSTRFQQRELGCSVHKLHYAVDVVNEEGERNVNLVLFLQLRVWCKGFREISVKIIQTAKLQI